MFEERNFNTLGICSRVIQRQRDAIKVDKLNKPTRVQALGWTINIEKN